MTSPIGFGSSQQTTKLEIAQEEHNQKAEEVKETEISKPSLQDEFNSLMQKYIREINVTLGGGTWAQRHIDTTYKKLTNFVADHPEFKTQLPEKYQAQDDRHNGAIAALATFATNSRNNGDQCVIQ